MVYYGASVAVLVGLSLQLQGLIGTTMPLALFGPKSTYSLICPLISEESWFFQLQGQHCSATPKTVVSDLTPARV